MQRLVGYLTHNIERSWYRRHWLSTVLLPLSWLYGCGVATRRWCYRAGILRRNRVPVPVLVVGNITVGGSGKTPFVIWLVELLQAQGFRPGIISRGYRGEASYWPQQVRRDSDPRICGDEPVLLARRCACPVVVSPDRVQGARALLAHSDCNLIVMDDGLQHYAIARDLEIALMDATRGFGNGRLLPAGPLREPVSRLEEVDYVVCKGAAEGQPYQMAMVNMRLCKLRDAGVEVEPGEFRGHAVHALAAIANPAGFFDELRRWGMEVVEHPFPDHHRFTPEELRFGDDLPVVMTEKDAVKCGTIGHDLCWYFTFDVELSGQLERKLLTSLEELGIDRQKAA